eukprot:TRINITY_DN29116_c0_g1_i1.p7 TRINITY_DN29116_c0_g1~~TRINITY_DN29116_c0_g1_i1.p7  ORF type:complete len:123 (-),score=18.00 TRINITY_DN29116_c0_g1_i1:910-1278(-)
MLRFACACSSRRPSTPRGSGLAVAVDASDAATSLPDSCGTGRESNCCLTGCLTTVGCPLSEKTPTMSGLLDVLLCDRFCAFGCDVVDDRMPKSSRECGAGAHLVAICSSGVRASHSGTACWN